MHTHTADAATHTGTGWMARVAMLAALAALLNTSWRRCQQTHVRRLASRPAALPEKVRVWEDEGGQNQMRDPAE